MSLLLANRALIKTTSNIPRDGLVAEYLFSGNANDTSGNGNNGTVNGATLTTGRKGLSNEAYSFDGINDYISINNDASLLSDVYSVSMWIYLPVIPSTNGHLYGCWTTVSTSNRNYSIRINSSGKVQLLNNDPSDTTSVYESSIGITTSVWYNIVCIHGVSSDYIYINGVLDSSSGYSSGSFSAGNKQNPSTPYTFGDYHSLDRPINAIIDDTRQYNRQLIANEITALYNE